MLPFFSLFGALILGREATDVANIRTCSPISSPVQCYHERNRGVRPEHRLHRQQDFSTLKAQLGGLEDAVSKLDARCKPQLHEQQRLRHESTRKKREPPKH